MLGKSKPALLVALASPIFGLAIAAYVQSRPNTTGVVVSGPFDAERAFADLKRIVRFGPRPSGSAALERTRQFIVGELHAAGVVVAEDKFTASTPIGPIPMVNLIAKIPGQSASIIILAGHYDTKRMATLFVGANDGGSSAAFLLEMARVMARRANKLTYWLVFFDGEEAVRQWRAKPAPRSGLRARPLDQRPGPPAGRPASLRRLPARILRLEPARPANVRHGH